MQEILEKFLEVYLHPGVIVWLWIELIIMFSLILLFRYKKNSSLVLFFELVFEKVYDFFEDLLGVEEKTWIKLYVTGVFFIIIFSNLLWVFLEFLLPVFWHEMEEFVKIPTADINFNIAMALISIWIVLLEQFRHLWLFHFLHEYFPVKWKNYIPYERGVLPKTLDMVVFWIIKMFDIVISLFLWLLEIIGLFAKIISLSFRLFWNVTSGGILLAMLIGALSWLTMKLANVEFPVLFSLVVYIQEILVAFIQAFVFPLLVAIFIKVAKIH